MRPLLSCGGALLIGGLLVHLFPAKPATDTSIPTEVLAPSPLVLAQSQLTTAHLASLTPRTLRGQFQYSTDMTGRAPVSGEVARWVVQPGAHVEAGDRVVEISTGAVSRPAPRAETQQTNAEREQVSAARGQTELAQQLTIAQTQLAAAQDRVTRAQEHLASTRTLIKRLRAGEQIPAPTDAPAPPRPRKRHRIERLVPTSSRSDAALTRAKSSLEAAKNQRDEARGAIAKAEKKLRDAQTALSKVEAEFKAEKTTADVLQNARTEVDDAQAALKSAQSRAEVADKKVEARQSQAEVAEADAKNSRKKADEAVATPATTPEASEEPSVQGRFLTADQAVNMVDSALQESKAATRSAERMRARIDDYQRRVHQTSQQAETASRDMQSAQQNVLDSTPRPVFTSARAPKSGTITWISRLALEVRPGQTIFGLSQNRAALLRFQDQGTAWKSLKVGQTLNAASSPNQTATSGQQPSVTPTATTAANSVAKPKAPAVDVPVVAHDNLSPSPANAPLASVFSIRITRITPPSKAGEAALIEAVCVDGTGAPGASANFVQVELPPDSIAVDPLNAGQTATSTRPVIVPASVVLPRDGATYVAVLSSNKPSGGSTGAQTKTPAQPEQISWRPVQVARETAFDVELKSGLREGDQVVVQPALLLASWKPEDKKPLSVQVESAE